MMDVSTNGLIETTGIVSTALILHELGHFFAASVLGAEIRGVVLGIGPPLMYFNTPGGTPVVLCLIPFGGKCIIDEYGSSNDDNKKDLPLWKKICIMLAGPAANISTVFAVMFVSNIVHGSIVVDDGWKVDAVTAFSDASRAGLLENDIITKINDVCIGKDSASYVSSLEEITTAPVVKLEARRGKDDHVEASVVPRFGDPGFKVVYNTHIERYGLIGSFLRSIRDIEEVSMTILTGYASFLTGDVSGLSAPFGLIGLQSSYALFYIVGINMTLWNMFPLVPLDGGLVSLYLYESIKGQRVREETVSALKRYTIAIIVFVFASVWVAGAV